MTDIEQAYVEGVLKVANHPKIKAACEPGVSRPEDLKEWQVVRVLRAQALLLKGLQKEQKKK